MTDQPPIEAALGAPLQRHREDGDMIVGIRDDEGRWPELKRF